MGGTSTGSVIFKVFVHGKKLFDSGVLRENDSPVPVKVSLEGAEELQLAVDDAGDGITADCADWADARLTRNPAAAKDLTRLAVDVARFARVLSWDPNAMEGTKAMRSDEIPAEDIAPYKEVLPSSDGAYTVPTMNGRGCIGLQWDENRIQRRLAIEFPDGATVPPPHSIQLECWTGESEWQGKWQPSAAAPEKDEDGLAWRLDCRELIGGTQKVRWVFSGAMEQVVLQRLSAWTRSRWKAGVIRIEPARRGAAQGAEIEVYNGAFRDDSFSPTTAPSSPWKTSTSVDWSKSSASASSR
jgi:hypothetical protein